MSKYAVQVKDVKKQFSYSRHKNNSLKRAITQIFKKKDTGKDSFFALDGISFNVEKGDFFGILGRNGSGKSTLLKIISEIYQPTSGSVTHDGKLVAFIELGVGFKPELSGRENVYLNAALLGFSKTEIDAMYDDIVEFAELEYFMEQSLKNYSSGMKVRLAFSVAIRAKADILILDEVLAVGDADFQRKCYNYFNELKEANRTIIFVTHSMGLVKQYCNKAILIEDGKITHRGDASDIADEYTMLFNKSKEASIDSARWGDRSVVIDSLDVSHDDRQITIDVTVHANEDAEGVKFGVQVIHQGKLIAGFNNLNVEGADNLNFTKGQSKKLMFSVDNIFGFGEYTLSVTVNKDNGLTTCDKLKSVYQFSSKKDNVHYVVTCPARLVIEDLD